MRKTHTYHQDGQGWDDANETISYAAYAGHGEGYNNPLLEKVRNVGPLPKGIYKIGSLEDIKNERGFGPGYMRLTPMDESKMFGRSGFLIHWNSHDANPYDSVFPNGASHGCIVLLDGANISKIAASPVKLVEVI
jgi:hypothetical protein